MKENNRIKKISIGLIATVASVSVLLGSLFDSSHELTAENISEQKAIISDINDQNKIQSEQPASFKEKLKGLILKLPVSIRTIVCVPLWALGSLLISAFETFFTLAIAPFAGIIIGFIIQTALLLLVIGISLKILFPDLPWSKIFNKKTILAAIAGSLLISILDHIMPLFFKKYRLYRFLFKTISGLIVILIIMHAFIRHKKKTADSYDIIYDRKALE